MSIRISIGKRLQGRSTKAVAAVIGGNLATNILSLVSSILVARWTTPHDLGLWNVALLVVIYSSVLQLGVFNGLNRQLPYFLGRQDKETSTTMAEVAYVWCAILMLISFLVSALVAIWFWINGETLYSQTTMAIGTILICSWMTQFLTVTYRTTSDFGRLARKNTLVALAGIPLTLFAWLLGYIGLMIRAAIVAVLSIGALYYKRPLSVRPKWRGNVFRQLTRVGLPIWFLGQMGTFFLTFDRLVLADSPQELGYYFLSIQFGTFVTMIPTAFSVVLYPQMAHKYGETHCAMDLWKISITGAIASSVFSATVGVAAWLSIPAFVDFFLPAYATGASAAQWASLMGLAMSFSIFNSIFNVIGRQDAYLVCVAFGSAIFFGMWLFLTRQTSQPHLIAAAQSMLVATLGMSAMSFIIASVTCRVHDRNTLSPTVRWIDSPGK